MRVLLLSIMAKCGVFTHVRDLAVCLQRVGIKPVIGFIYDSGARYLFKVSASDRIAMEESLNGIPYFYYSSDSSLYEMIKEVDIDFIHAHSPLVLKSAAKMKALLKIPFVATLHGVIDWSGLYGNALQLADDIIAIGPEVADSAGSGFKEKVKIVFNGIDTEHFIPNPNRTSDKTLKIVWTGRTSGTAARGAGCLSQSVGRLKKMGLSVDAKIIGHANGAAVRDMEILGWVHDPLPILQWSDIAFGRGRSLREAMACGSAGFLLAEGYGGLVSSKWFDNGRHPQLSGSLKHGCSELDPQQIAKDILYFYRHRDRLEAAKREAREIAEKYFDVKVMADETCRIYDRILS